MLVSRAAFAAWLEGGNHPDYAAAVAAKELMT
jgi:hypothetical protein